MTRKLEKDFFLKETQEKAGIGSYEADFILGQWHCCENVNKIIGINEAENKTLQVWLDLIHPNDLRMIKNYIKTDILGKGKKFDKEYKIIRKDNQKVIWVHGIAEVKVKDNKVTSIMGTLQDVTARKKIENKLREVKDLLLSITNGTDDLIFTKDLEGKYTSANRAFEFFLGMSEKEIIGKVGLEKFKIGNKNQFLITDQEIIDTGECITRGGILNFGEEGDKCFSITKGPIYDDYGNISGFFAIVRDITKQKDDAELLKRVNEQLEIRQRMDSLGTLAGGIGHDFNNLLSGIIGNLELASLEVFSPEKHIIFIKKAMEASVRAAALVKQLQNLSKNSISEMVIFDIYSVAQDVFNLLEKSTDKIIEKVIDFNVGDFYIHGSESEIHQVLLNLGTNSALSIKEGGYKEDNFIKIRIEDYRSLSDDVTSLPEGDYLHIFFEDNGTGMSEDIIRQAFDPLFTTREKSGAKGQGLGLAMVYNIIKNKHKGHISIESKEGVGTTFHLYLPKAPKCEKIIPEKLLKPTGGSETILIIEDEEDIQQMVKTALEEVGYKVLVANNGQEGLDTYIKENELIDLVLLDLIMPKMGGETVLENILKINESVRVIITSGQKNKDKLSLSKAKYFIAKPYSLYKLEETIRAVLDEENVLVSVSEEC